MSKCKGTTEIYSRVTGFMRPVQTWNKGKVHEFNERKHFDKSVQNEKEEKRKETATVC